MAAPISKQERIRLNQQRSRARKQEYLQDLEKRVLDCHTSCREADLQRESYQQLRLENLKLRALLASLGFGEVQIDSYVNSDASEPSAEQAALRHLRPKLQAEVPSVQAEFLPRLDDIANRPVSNIPNSITATTVSSAPSSCGNSTCPSARPEVDEAPLTTSSTLNTGQPHYCDTFLAYFEPSLQPTSENSVLCSQARDLIDQCNISGQDIQNITFRLAAGFAPELRPGEGCRVDKRLLFEVLNDISLNLS
jgi:hypothetical protein